MHPAGAQRRSIHRLGPAMGVAAAALAMLWSGCMPSFGQAAPDAMTLRLNQVKSSNIADRTAASKLLIDDWTTSLEPLAKELAKLEPAAAASNHSPADIQAMLGITDALRSILANKEKDGAIDKFRKIDDDPKVIQALAWMARSDNRDLRINSTYILANVIDNTNVCIVLKHLSDPTINANGRINLLQTITPVASYAYKENKELIEKILPDVKASAKSDNEKTLAIINQVTQRLKTSSNATDPLPANLRLNCPASLR